MITDDQGYGDLGCTGNPRIKTPDIDAFYRESVRLNDFHVQPLCAPTRSAIMTGHRPLRNGVWATCWGRSILRSDETTMADIFTANGYTTGMFGKWHLGDNYPYRPQDRGFQRVVAHKGGGVGQTPDFWGNDYFDDTYFHNGKPVRHTGYCTDVWFGEAMKFISDCEEPFFAYIATNAPHSPYLVEERYVRPYAGNPEISSPEFYGMIANIDENFGKLRRMLSETGLEKNTILIFMTDNGSSGGCVLDDRQYPVRGYGAGMRGMKGSYYDGGHRVPFFIRWPGGNIGGGRDVGEMCLDIDLMPTLTDLCGMDDKDTDPDGTSLADLITGKIQNLPADRIHFIQYVQNTDPPPKDSCAVMTRKWRLINSRELYDILSDPEQRRDTAGEHPEIVQRLRSEHSRLYDALSPSFCHYSPVILGHEAENPTCLNAMDVMGDVAWNQRQIAEALKSSDRWTVRADRPGTYRFALRRWPEELNLPSDAVIDAESAGRLVPYQADIIPRGIQPEKAKLVLFGQVHTADYTGGSAETVFIIEIERTDETILEAFFIDREGGIRSAYYVYAERL